MRPRYVLIGILLCAAFCPGARAASPAGLLDGFPRAGAVIETSRNLCLLLDLYIADSSPRQARGLMYVEKLGEFEGMLFRYPRPARIAMWMKNTYIPLDMLFLQLDGTIVHVVENTTPLSLERITAPEPVTMVIELAGGFARRWDIRSGNRLLLVERPSNARGM